MYPTAPRMRLDTTRGLLRTLYSMPVALAAGVLLAFLALSGAPYVAWLGEIFLSLLKVLILPLILVSIYGSLTAGPNLRLLGGRTLLYYLLTSAFAASLGALLGITFARLSSPDQPPPELIDAAGGPEFSPDGFIQNLFPSNLFDSLAQGNILHIVFIAIFAALASRYLAGDRRRFLLDGAMAANDLLMQMLRAILAVAPVGILSLVYAGLVDMPWDEVFQLRSFAWAVAIAASVHALLFLPGLYLVKTGRSPLRFAGAVKPALMTAFSTASSAATYPVSKRVLEENAGVSSRTTGFTLPLGATLNMDGFALYHAILLIFMAQLAGVELSPLQALLLVLLTMGSSAGTAGIPSGGIAMMAFMLDLMGLPQTYVALYLIVDRFFDYPITAINVWGDLTVASLVDQDLRKG